MCTPWTLRRLIIGHQAKSKPSRTRFSFEDDSEKAVLTSTEKQSNESGSRMSIIKRRKHKKRVTMMSKHGFHNEEDSNKAVLTSTEQTNNVQASSSGSRTSVMKRGKHKRRVTIGSNNTSSSCSSSLGYVVDGGDETDWPPFTDEDYIVFCFEEHGEFHLVMDQNSKDQHCYQHGQTHEDQCENAGDLASPSTSNMVDIIENNTMSRRDSFLPNKAIEEERFYFSPRLQSDGIKSLTRFKDVDYEDMKVIKARVHVDEDTDYEEMDGIKRREQENLKEKNEEEEEEDDDDLECHKVSMECRDGSVESTGSSRPDWVRHLQVTKTDQEIGLSSSSSSSKKGKLITLMYKEVEDEESVYLSSESQEGGDDEHSNKEESAETSDTSDLEEDEETALDSAKSKGSLGSSSSFEFPVMQWDWIGSPVKWPRSKSIRLRKHKSSRVCLRCCRF